MVCMKPYCIERVKPAGNNCDQYITIHRNNEQRCMAKNGAIISDEMGKTRPRQDSTNKPELSETKKSFAQHA